MRIPKDATLLRVFVGEQARHDGKPLFETIVREARHANLAGATVLRGPLGYGHSSRLHSAKILALSEDLPMVIEIVDSPEKIEAFLPILDVMMGDKGLITLERIQVLRYGPNPSS
ncbi:hypothetical protein H261_09809 [Paramagnetospirillum caucaseum]|uniref:Uncharacterized protein n=1 Tax=Paramagnetospirillum caucaseum TaxID=1244869 RepID=M2ZRY9_9PROT|nr:DUF190 domain-containing protein [Paramagnetospirillum caucaseum]EME70092.1 hypothetical protein H261_09809 [Paramagnetospirillum caucaseum]